MAKPKRTPREDIERAFHVSFKLPQQAAALLDAYRDQVLTEAAALLLHKREFLNHVTDPAEQATALLTALAATPTATPEDLTAKAQPPLRFVCGAAHWSLTVTCSMPPGHDTPRHVGWNARNGTRGRKCFRFDPATGITEVLDAGHWQPTTIPAAALEG